MVLQLRSKLEEKDKLWIQVWIFSSCKWTLTSTASSSPISKTSSTPRVQDLKWSSVMCHAEEFLLCKSWSWYWAKLARTTSRGFGSGLRQAILNVPGLSTRARRTASICRSWTKLSIRIISDTGWPREETLGRWCLGKLMAAQKSQLLHCGGSLTETKTTGYPVSPSSTLSEVGLLPTWKPITPSKFVELLALSAIYLDFITNRPIRIHKFDFSKY